MSHPPLQESETRELFRALELAHYAERFRSEIFVAALPQGVSFREILLDVKVLNGHQIRVVLVCHESDAQLGPAIEVANKRGANFRLFPMRQGEAPPASDALLAALGEGATPVVAWVDGGGTPDGGPDPVCGAAGDIAQALSARKLFLLDARAESLLRLLPRSSVQLAELDALVEPLAAQGVAGAEALLGFIAAQLRRGIHDVVVLEPRTGQLFREVFTYEGAGLLCNATRETRIRRGELQDVTEIGMLLRPEIEAGRIRAWNENETEAGIDRYWLYEMDGKVVGLACIKPHGDWAELAHFATLPRFRGKGRARELALHLIEQARQAGMHRVFALSVDERMWDFFTGLGFQEFPREQLPESWRRQYDMSRPSRAFALAL